MAGWASWQFGRFSEFVVTSFLQAASNRVNNTPLLPNPQTTACCSSRTSWPAWKHILFTTAWHIFLPMLARAAIKPAVWSVKSRVMKFLIKCVIPFRALSQGENLTCLEQMQGNCTSVMLLCLPPGGSCRLFKQQTFRRGHPTLGK